MTIVGAAAMQLTWWAYSVRSSAEQARQRYVDKLAFRQRT